MFHRVEGLLRGLTILVECDNTTAVAYLNKQGGTRSQTLCQEAIAINEWLIVRQASVVAVHRPGVDNQLADLLSRNRPDPTEWSLADSVGACLWQRVGASSGGCVRLSSQPQAPCLVQPVASQVCARHRCTPAVVGGL